MALTINCPSCGYDLSKTAGSQCPECGAYFDRATLIRPPTRRVPGAAIAVVLLFAIGWPTLMFFGAWLQLFGGLRNLLVLAVPYSVLLAHFVPSAFTVAYVFAMVQGPAYGIALGLRWPPRAHPWTWLFLLGSHVLAILCAWAFA